MRYVPAIIQHLWISTLFLAFMLAAVLALRSRLTASARFTLALTGIAKFAIPAGAIGLFGRSATQVVALPVPAMAILSPTLPPPAARAVWPEVVLVIWVVIAAIIIIRFTIMHHRLLRLVVNTALPPTLREVAAMARARARLGVSPSIDIARSSLSEAPAVLRIVRPLIVLPSSGCDDLSDAELEALLCHECAHIRRQDNLIARIESFICALFWFHPLIWIAQRVTVIERERACDEAVSDSADERKTYLAALAKFCHAGIVPRLPGVSCMATSQLKERMDHVENYEKLRSQAPSPRRIAAIGIITLVAYTILAGLTSNSRVLAGENTEQNGRYAIKMSALRSGETITLQARVTDNETQEVLANPQMKFAATENSESRYSINDVDMLFRVPPIAPGKPILVEVTIDKKGSPTYRMTVSVSPTDAIPTVARKYTGAPISLNLKDADIRDVLKTFADMTGLKMQIDESVSGKVTVSWVNVPWDQAFDEILHDNGLTYRLQGANMQVMKK